MTHYRPQLRCEKQTLDLPPALSETDPQRVIGCGLVEIDENWTGVCPTLSLEKHRRVTFPQKKVQTLGCVITVSQQIDEADGMELTVDPMPTVGGNRVEQIQLPCTSMVRCDSDRKRASSFL